MLKYHIPFYLIGNIEISSARQTLNALLIPADRYFKIPQVVLAFLYKYLKKTSFWSFLMDIFIDFNQNIIMDKINMLKDNFPVAKFDDQVFDEFPRSSQKNPF